MYSVYMNTELHRDNVMQDCEVLCVIVVGHVQHFFTSLFNDFKIFNSTSF
jgi:hypothetical protein